MGISSINNQRIAGWEFELSERNPGDRISSNSKSSCISSRNPLLIPTGSEIAEGTGPSNRNAVKVIDHANPLVILGSKLMQTIAK